MTDNDDLILPREGIAKAYNLVDSLLMGPQSQVTGKYYYVNYTRHEGSPVGGRWVTTEEEVHIGPYPYRIAEVVKILVGSIGFHKNDYSLYAYRLTLSIKPRRGSRKTVGPTRDEIESYLLGRVSGTLITYKGLQDWYATNTGEQI